MDLKKQEPTNLQYLATSSLHPIIPHSCFYWIQILIFLDLIEDYLVQQCLHRKVHCGPKSLKNQQQHELFILNIYVSHGFHILPNWHGWAQGIYHIYFLERKEAHLHHQKLDLSSRKYVAFTLWSIWIMMVNHDQLWNHG